MGSITIRHVDERIKSRRRMRAAEHGHSMEEETRIILRTALTGSHSGETGPWAGYHGGIDLIDPWQADPV